MMSLGDLTSFPSGGRFALIDNTMALANSMAILSLPWEGGPGVEVVLGGNRAMLHATSREPVWMTQRRWWDPATPLAANGTVSVGCNEGGGKPYLRNQEKKGIGSGLEPDWNRTGSDPRPRLGRTKGDHRLILRLFRLFAVCRHGGRKLGNVFSESELLLVSSFFDVME